MRSEGRQQELPMPDATLARAYRIAADTVRHDPLFPYAQREARAAYYEAQARALQPEEGCP